MNEFGRLPIAGRFGIPDKHVKNYIAAAERVAAESCESCDHLRGDHRRPSSYFPYDTSPGMMCSLCSCGW